MAHTPGPWRLHPDSGVIIVNGSTVYSVKDLTTEHAVGMAGDASLDDKRLMAAAPELLAALKAIKHDLLALDSGDVGNGVDGWRHMDATFVDQLISGSFRVAKDAINKAEERSD